MRTRRTGLRARSIAMIAAALVTALVAGPAEAQTAPRPGDLDGSGGVTVTDVQSCINQALGISPATAEGDVDRDGGIAVTDVQIVIELALGALRLTALTPNPLGPGDVLTIEGVGFDLDAGDNMVSINGTAVPVDAVLLAGADPVGLTLTLPFGVTSGPVTVTTPTQTLGPLSLDVAFSLDVRVAIAPVDGATVEAYALTPSGPGTRLDTAVTVSGGLARLDFGANRSYAGPVLLEATGGAYRDLANGGFATLGATLRTAFIHDPSVARTINITPLTSLAVEVARNTNGGFSAMNIMEANEALAQSTTLVPADLLEGELFDPMTPPASPTSIEQSHSLVVASFPLAVRRLGASSTDDLLAKLALDLRDGTLDGVDGSTGATVLADQAIFARLGGVARELSELLRPGAIVPLAGQVESFYTTNSASLAAAGGATRSQDLPGLDQIPPVLLQSYPEHGEADVPTNIRIVLQFSDDLDQTTTTSSTVTMTTAAGLDLTPTVSAPNGGLVTLFPVSALPPLTDITVTFSTAVRDVAGNALSAPVQLRFRTGAGPQTTNPTRLAITPPVSSRISADGIFDVLYDRAMLAELRVGGISTLRTFGIPEVCLPLPGYRRFLITSRLRFAPDLVVDLSLGRESDFTGNLTPSSGGSFPLFFAPGPNAPDVTAPNLSFAGSPIDRNDIGPLRFVLTEQVDPVQVVSGASLTRAGQTVPGRWQTRLADGLVVFQPEQPLTPGAGYDFSFAAGLVDFAGNAKTTPTPGSFAVAPALLALSEAALPTLYRGVAGMVFLSASGGAPPYTFSLAAGSSLPAGLSLSPDGAISGAPTQFGFQTTQVTVTDSEGTTHSGATQLFVDFPPAIATVAFANPTVSETEADATVTIPVQLTAPAPLGAAITVPITLREVSATAGVDATLNTSSVTFPVGASTGDMQSVTLTLHDDGLREFDETLILGFGTATGPLLAAGNTSCRVTITDDETDPILTFDPTTLPASESDGTVTATVRLSHPTARPVSVDLIPGGTATIPADLTLQSPGRLTGFSSRVEPGALTRTVVLNLVQDGQVEGGETFTLTLANPSGAILGAATTVTVVLTD